ncbi:hypothetical protein ISCGN_005202 [Ixodes scapularis]
MLQLLSFENHNDFCLTYVLTNRDFSFGTLGLAYLAYPDAAGLLETGRGPDVTARIVANCGPVGRPPWAGSGQQPCFIVAVYAIAVCNARRFSFHVRHRQLPPEIILLFGGFKPSQGHGVRMCKVLSSEWHRQARFYKECLFLMLQGTTSNGHGGRRWREYRELADATAEFHWRRMLSELRASAPKRAAPSRSTVHTLGQVSLPESIRRVLDRGPKFAVEPKKSRAELLSLVRDVARKVPEAEAERTELKTEGTQAAGSKTCLSWTQFLRFP